MKPNYTALLLFLFYTSAYSQVKPYHVTTCDSASRGFYFLSTTKSGLALGANHHLILDAKGNVVYYQPMGLGKSSYDFKLQRNGLMSYFLSGKYYLMDSTFTLKDSISIKGAGYTTDLHELQILPNGHYLLLGEEVVKMDLSSYNMFLGKGAAGSRNAKVTSGIIQEQDANKKVVFEWHAKDHLAFDDVDAYWLFDTVSVDWTHYNALEMDKDSNILVSSRHFNEITKISHKDGSVIWRFGGKKNQFSFLNDTLHFYGQHDIRRLPNGHITLYDNGRYVTSHGARPVEYEMDETNKTVKLLWSYMYDSSMNCYATGNVQRLPDGRTLVNYGLLNANKTCFAVVDSSGHRSMDVVFDNAVFSYRSFNYFSLPWSWRRPQVSCFDSMGVSYLDAGPGYAAYRWSDGRRTRKIALSAAGTYYVGVPLGKGFVCSETILVANPRNPCSLPCKAEPQIFGSIAPCGGVTTLYAAAYHPYSSYQWRIEGGAIVSGQGTDSVNVLWHNDTIGRLILVETAYRGCSDSAFITINPILSPFFSGSDNACRGSVESYVAAPHLGSTYEWKIQGGGFIEGKGSDTVWVQWGYGSSGSLTMIETNSNNCVDSFTSPVTLRAIPAASISGLVNVCASSVTTYRAKTLKDSAFHWKIKGGIILTSANSSNIYVKWSKDSVGSLTLLETNTKGCSDSVTLSVRINPVAVVSITGQPKVCSSSVIAYSGTCDLNTVPQWKVQGGTILSGQGSRNISVQWDKTATSGSLTLTGSNDAGCNDSAIYPVVINPLPAPAITGPQKVCAGDLAVYIAASHPGSSYTWEVTGGNLISGQGSDSIAVLWPSASSGTVSLTEANAVGCKDSAAMSILILDKPQVAITGDNTVCAGETAVYHASAHPGSNYVWRVWGGLLSGGLSSDSVQVTWTSAGSRMITVVETNSSGCSDSSALNVEVNDLPLAAFDNNNICAGTPAVFYNRSTGTKSCYWAFGDGGVSALSDPSHTYTSPGRYDVSLEVASESGCTDIINRQVEVHALPDAVWQYVDTGRSFRFFAVDTFNAGYDWDFGDGKYGTGYNTNHQYAEDGDYHVRLMVTSSAGCTASFDTIMTARALVNADVQVKNSLPIGISVYPNPASRYFTLSYVLTASTKVRLSLADLQGRELLLLSDAIQPSGSNTCSFDAGMLSPGTYILRFSQPGRLIEKPVIISH